MAMVGAPIEVVEVELEPVAPAETPETAPVKEEELVPAGVE